jgi:hypothetical protein
MKKNISVRDLNLMKTWTEILLNLTQIQDYTMANTWLHGFDGGMLHVDAHDVTGQDKNKYYGQIQEIWDLHFL